MKYCSNCGAELNNDATKCEACGAAVAGVVMAEEWDHTAEFDSEDIEKNKIFALLCYLTSIIGIALVFLGAKDSPYAMYHAKQAIKLEVSAALALLAGTFLCWTCIAPVAAMILLIIICVLEIICIFQVFFGYAKEPWLIRSFKFLGKM